MGWYGGAGARVVRSIRNIDGENQGRWDPLRGVQDCKTCKLDPATLLLEANWKRSLQIKVGNDWVSGYYLVRLHELKTDTAAYVVFIVRDDDSPAPILVQASTNTWQAYNTWGDASLYGSFGADRKYVAKTRRAYRVSYDRPYDMTMRDTKNYGAGDFFSWEYNFVRWSESRGYDMTYTTNVDVSLRGDLLKKRRLFISLGHDEYWTKQERDAVEAARDAGVNIAFFGGNEAYWQGRIEDSTAGVKARVLTVYKDATLDPQARTNPKETTILFKDPPVSRPAEPAVRRGVRLQHDARLPAVAAGLDRHLDLRRHRNRRGAEVPGHRRIRVRPHGRAAGAAGRIDGGRQLVGQRIPRRRYLDLVAVPGGVRGRQCSPPARSAGRGGSTISVTRNAAHSPTIG